MPVQLRNGRTGRAAEVSPSAMLDADMVLVAAARRGEQQAYETLLNRYERRMFRLAMNITRSREDAEEVVQDAFLRAFSRLDTFQGDARFSTWLTRIAINQALMKLRKRRPNVMPLDELMQTEDGSLPREIIDWGPNPEQRYTQQELGEILNAAIAGLDPLYQVVFQLRDIEQFSIQETAEALNISVSAVKSRLLRARLELRERLSKRFGLRQRRREASARHNYN